MSFVKVEAFVTRERIETVIDAVEEQTGHVGVTVLEAVGHGKQRGITHEYRGRVFESRFLPKALLVFVADASIAGSIASTIADAARSGNESGDGIVWTSSVGQKPFDWFSEIPGAAGYLFEVVFAGVSLAIVWGSMAERAKLWVYFVFGVYFTLVYSIVSHWIWSPHGWLFAKGMQDFAGSTVVHYQGALAALAGALLLGPRIGKFGHDGRANPIPGHNIPYAVLGTLILWFGWFGFNPGSTLSVDFGGFGYFAYVALTTNIAAATGAVAGMLVAWLKLGKPDISMMLNGALGALVAIPAASGFVAPWAAIVIGLGSGMIAVFGVIFVERFGIDDPIGAVAVHGMSRGRGTPPRGLFPVPPLAGQPRAGNRRPRLTGAVPPPP